MITVRAAPQKPVIEQAQIHFALMEWLPTDMAAINMDSWVWATKSIGNHRLLWRLRTQKLERLNRLPIPAIWFGLEKIPCIRGADRTKASSARFVFKNT
jgi:hypothetical protein